jgi:hypothetical protein
MFSFCVVRKVVLKFKTVLINELRNTTTQKLNFAWDFEKEGLTLELTVRPKLRFQF